MSEKLDIQRLNKICCEMLHKDQKEMELENGLKIEVAPIENGGIGIHTGVTDEGWRRRPQ